MEGFDQIKALAKRQNGYLAAYQLPQISPQLFYHHEKSGNIERLYRGIYRLDVYPTHEDEPYIVAYLWSHERGTLSHDTALSIHQISDILPKTVHVTLPMDEKPIRREQPEWLTVHFSDLDAKDRSWFGMTRVTTPARTLIDIARVTNLETFERALDDAKEKKLVPENFERQLILELVANNK